MTLKHALEGNMTRSYGAHLWEELEIVQSSSLLYLHEASMESRIITASLDSSADRLYEDPEYLKQHVVYWDDSADVAAKTIPPEQQAFVTSQNAIYLRKVNIDPSMSVSATLLLVLLFATLQVFRALALLFWRRECICLMSMSVSSSSHKKVQFGTLFSSAYMSLTQPVIGYYQYKFGNMILRATGLYAIARICYANFVCPSVNWSKPGNLFFFIFVCHEFHIALHEKNLITYGITRHK